MKIKIYFQVYRFLLFLQRRIDSIIQKVESKLPYVPEDISGEYDMEGLVPGTPEFLMNSRKIVSEH